MIARRDRLARFGVELIELALQAQGRRLVVIDSAEGAYDLVRNKLAVLTPCCGRRDARTYALPALRSVRERI